ncbi:hypothetical protein EG328_005248 [Venturia inaequalis]|uniref:Uncharacterized protein n=1 Tax=Venturia inaequalis TaxID=5025 RepID=A0A8H3ULZ0_VENIN|nr:hypothetical protein EG328_005248 [Venturia inaequalis]RDI81516.1 hypothetical protein Vi05172_g8508 [Venturia inaequalis]
MHLWSPRRGKLNAAKRSMSSPATAIVTGMSSSLQQSLSLDVVKSEESAGEMTKEGDKKGLTEVVRDGVGAARDALMGNGLANSFGGKDRKEDGWAPGLFYAYARRTNLPNSARYILTFSSAKTCQEWWSLVQSEFGGPPSNTRESAQLFSFSGDDMPGRAWKNPRFGRLKTKWFYTQMGDAVGTSGRGRGMEVLPLQDEKGWGIGVTPSPGVDIQRRPSSVESLVEAKGRRWSKRDSGVLLMSPFSEHFKNTEEAIKAQQSTEDNVKIFDFERMEKNLEKVEKMMEQNAQQMRSLEHIQAANLERLTAALLHNVEMVQELARGQEGLVHACEELRTVVDTREESDQARRLAVEKAERERKMLEDKANRERLAIAEKAEKKRQTIAEKAEKEWRRMLEENEKERRAITEKAEKDRQVIAEKAEKEWRRMLEQNEKERKTMTEKTEKDRQVIAEKAELERRRMLEKNEKERRATIEKAEKAEREMKSMAAALEKLERQSRSDQEERAKLLKSKGIGGHHLTRSPSILSTATEDTIATSSPCGHVVGKGPRKLGRQVVGYIYASDEQQDVAPIQRDKRKTERG